MRNSSIALAVAGIMAASSANAAVDLYVSGASAQRSFWLTDFTATCAAAPTVYKVTGLTDNPDNQAWRCVSKTPSVVAGVADGEQMTVHYSAELGAGYGITLALPGRPTTRLFVNPDSTDCSGSSCAITAYNVSLETHSSVSGNALVSHTADVLVTDMEPTLWASAANWPNYANWNPGGVYTVPTKAELTALLPSYKVVNGQVFSAIVNSGSALAALGNVSKASLSAIATGKYKTWAALPELGAAGVGNIVLCRRDQGSGTQVSASVFLTGVECNRGTVGFVTQQGAPGLYQVIENGTTDKVRKCVQDNVGGIGFTSLGASTSFTYTTLRIDGIQANAHNGAAGIYPWAFESLAFDRTASAIGNPAGASAGAQGLANRMLTNARGATTLPAIEGGSLLPTNGATGMAGTWFAASPKTNFAVAGPSFGNTPKSLAKWASTTAASVALTYRGGDNCKVALNDNAN